MRLDRIVTAASLTGVNDMKESADILADIHAEFAKSGYFIEAKTTVYEPTKRTDRPIVIVDGIAFRANSMMVIASQPVMLDERIELQIPRHPNMWEINTRDGALRFFPENIMAGKRKSGRPVVYIETRNGIKGVMNRQSP